MMRLSLMTELIAPVAALTVAAAAARTGQPALLLLLPLLWFAPSALRAWLSLPLDERETACQARAEAWALRLLLVTAAALPWLLAVGGAETLRRESADLGFLLAATFVARAVVLAGSAMSAGGGAHVAGALATLVVVLLMAGRAWPDPSGPALLLLLTLAPHLAASLTPGLAALLWGVGALAVVANVLTAGFAPIEVLLLLALLAAPWTAAGMLAARASRQPAEA